VLTRQARRRRIRERLELEREWEDLRDEASLHLVYTWFTPDSLEREWEDLRDEGFTPDSHLIRWGEFTPDLHLIHGKFTPGLHLVYTRFTPDST
jgi:hypothetical protein